MNHDPSQRGIPGEYENLVGGMCPRHSLFKDHNVIVDIVVLDCQKCNQCLKSQVFEGVMAINIVYFGFTGKQLKFIHFCVF